MNCVELSGILSEAPQYHCEDGIPAARVAMSFDTTGSCVELVGLHSAADNLRLLAKGAPVKVSGSLVLLPEGFAILAQTIEYWKISKRDPDALYFGERGYRWLRTVGR